MFADPLGWDDGLDEAQLLAATHGDGPLVVVAGAGTGKTRTLTARLACLLERGASPEGVLLLTFTRRAAEEMLARAARLAGLRRGARPQGGTFHSVAHRNVAACAPVLGFANGFGVLDPAGAADLMDILRAEHGLTGTTVRLPRSATLVELYSRCVNTSRRLGELVPAEYPWCEPHLDEIGSLFRAFTEHKRRSGLLDFDDLLVHWLALLRDGDLRALLADRYSHVLVDEYQDVNSLQREIVGHLCPEGRGLTLVGDEAQAIYGFRGSDPSYLREAASMPGATVVTLERNFRSQQRVLDVANKIRPPGHQRLELHSNRGTGEPSRLVRCYDASGEARAIVESVLDAHERGVALRDQAVLVRAAHHSDLVELELTIRRVPFKKYGGLRFLEAAHVRDFVAAARLLDHPCDEVAWYRVLRLHRSIGPARARALLGVAAAEGVDSLDGWAQVVAAAPASGRAALSRTLAGLLAARDVEGAARRCEGVLRAIEPLVLERYPDASPRLADLERLAAAAVTVEDLWTWLAELTLDPPASTGDLAGAPHLDEDFVVISTIHSAKGLEWPIVHVPHVIDGMIPIDMALSSEAGLEEERRLLYVAVTRAADELHLYSPLRMPHHRFGGDDRHTIVQASRFLDDEVLATLEVHEQSGSPSIVGLSATGSVRVDLDALWR